MAGFFHRPEAAPISCLQDQENKLELHLESDTSPHQTRPLPVSWVPGREQTSITRGGQRPKRQSLLVRMLRRLCTGQSVVKNTLCNQFQNSREEEEEKEKKNNK